jgi:hypothetical protein
MIEGYDFYPYAITAALAFSKLHFPSHDRFISPIGSLGFFARPLHGPIVGQLGDPISAHREQFTSVAQALSRETR